jgi:DNA helicase-2/ATP-dependent DNA helicase PcrA
VGDTAQRVEEGFPGWEKLSRFWTARKVESSFVRLEVSHRSTRQIVLCAAALAGIETPAGGRNGPRPQWFVARAQDPVIGASIEWLQEVVAAAPNALVGVVCFSAAAAKEAFSLLSPSFGPMVRMSDDGTFSFGEGIVVCDAYTAKGLEFHAVLVYQPSMSVLPKGEVGRNLLYIASTRAQEKLAFATWGGPSPLQSCPRRLLDKVDLDQLAREAEEAQRESE